MRRSPNSSLIPHSSSLAVAILLPLGLLAACRLLEREWVTVSASPTAVLRGAGSMDALAWSPDGTRLAAGCGAEFRLPEPEESPRPVTCEVQLWSVPGAAVQRRVALSRGKVWALGFAAGGRTLLAGSRSETVRWDLASGQAVRLAGDNSAPGRPLAFSPDGRWLVRSDTETGWLCDLRTGRQVRNLSEDLQGIGGACFSGDGDRLALNLGVEVRVWTARPAARSSPRGSYEPRWRLPLPRLNPACLALSRDGTTLAVGGDEGELLLWEPETGRCQLRFRAFPRGISSLAFSPDGRTVAFGTSAYDDAAEAQLWDLRQLRLTHRFLGHQSNVVSLAFSPDGRTLATASHDRTIRLWKLAKEGE